MVVAVGRIGIDQLLVLVVVEFVMLYQQLAISQQHLNTYTQEAKYTYN